jgi:Flp pilus assembly protein CpaB
MQILIGVILVVIAFVGVLLFGRIGGSGGGGGAKAHILVAARDLKVAQPITDADLAFSDVDVAPTGALTDKTMAIGKLTRSAISSGSPIRDSDLAVPATQAAAKLYFTLKAGDVALNIPSSDISPYVQPGDEIDIIATLKPGSGTTVTQTKATLKGLKVLSVGTPGTPSAGNLVVEVSLAQAELIQFLVKNTDYTYVLKSPLDAGGNDPTTTGVDLGTFKSTFGFR